MLLTLQALRAVGASPLHAQRWLAPLQLTCDTFEINTPERVAAFLAQIGHESMGLSTTTELWGPTDAQRRYEGRKDLGNVQPGDGSKFRGHGLIHTTGRANHVSVRDRLRARIGPQVPDFEVQPQQLAQGPWAALSAGDYWQERKINALADANDIRGITRKVNGGLNGYSDRLQRWLAVCRVLGVNL